MEKDDNQINSETTYNFRKLVPFKTLVNCHSLNCFTQLKTSVFYCRSKGHKKSTFTIDVKIVVVRKISTNYIIFSSKNAEVDYEWSQRLKAQCKIQEL